MAIPPPPGPPPAPGPPPPPAMGGLKLAGAGSGGDARSALLQSIQKGAKLKKTVTVDKSGPLLAGKIQGETGSTVKANTSPKRNVINNTVPNGGPKLGGLFEGMSSMPKLKPVGGRGTPSGTPNRNVSPTKTVASNSTPSPQVSNGPLDFNAELTKHLTLKKQKQQGVVTEANLRTARGPPPQPPGQPKNLPLSSSDSVLDRNGVTGKVSKAAKASSPTLSEGSNSSSSTQSSKKNATNLSLSLANNSNVNISSNISSSQLTPNKSALFGANNNDNSNLNSSSSSSISSNATKPTINYGKPNCAPKPPGIQQLIASNTGNNSKPVSRHHSMKSPRSPPIAQPGGPVFPTTQTFGTMRNPSQLYQSHEAINSSVRLAPNPPIGRPTVAPPKPPTVKPPPPPTPIRSASNTNLSNLPLSAAPSLSANNSATTANNKFGSTNNVSSLKDQFSRTQLSHGGSVSNVSNLTTSANNNSGKLNSPVNNRDKIASNSTTVVAPPLPPHRTCPAPPPPQRQASNNQLNAPPVPPQRHSSIRMNSIVSTTTSPTIVASTITTVTTNISNSNNNHNNNIASNISNSGGGNVNKKIFDLEMKFGNRFHKVNEFTKPPPYLNVSKIYPSRNHVKTSNVTEVRKPRAPEPPASRPPIQAQ